MGYYVLLALYALLLLFYAWEFQRPTILSWPYLTRVDSTSATTCQEHSDCDAHHLCVFDTCVPQLLRGEECYPETGAWTLVAHLGKSFAACICNNPELVSQKYFGGNCDVQVACQPHGTFDLQTDTCSCDEGYVPSGYTCKKMLAIERMQYSSCGPHEIYYDQIKPEDGFTDAYLEANRDKKCFKRPCTFDALSGLPLKRARYEENMGCVCDPTLGQFGVRIEHMNDYVRGPGYNACQSIFSIPIEKPIPVNIMAHFYLMQRDPVVMLIYENLDPNKLIKPLTGGSLQISQEFPYDYMQVFFRERQPYRARTREFHFDTYHFTQKKKNWVMKNNRMEWCRYMTRHLSFLKNSQLLQSRHLYKNEQKRNWTWALLYGYPACYIGRDDTEAPEKYRGRYVSNPLHLTFTEFPKEDRSNGLFLQYGGPGEWILDLVRNYDVQTYIQAAIPSMVPFITNPVLEGVIGGHLTQTMLDRHQSDYEQAPKEITF